MNDSPLYLFDGDTRRWFESEIGQPTPVQRMGWPAIARGKNVLISAPTGTGKTLTAFLTLIDRLNRLAKQGELKEQVYVIYISPLKALGNDIQVNLRRPIDGIGAPIAVAVRNGDTTPGQRQAMLRHPPHILITTPESLFLMLTSEKARSMLATARAVIVDELHAMLGSKRGTHLLLCLTRLQALCGGSMQRIGLSATIRPLDRAAHFLGGRGTEIIAPQVDKQKDVQVLSPRDMAADVDQSSVWPAICRCIYDEAMTRNTVLVFCEGRATAEKVGAGLNALGGDGFCRTHHGSMAREQRIAAEIALKSGQLKVLCATSSMELGIDVGDIDLVVQIGCPRRLSGAAQRLGRSGHRPGAVSEMQFYPRMAHEALLCALTTSAMSQGFIEPTNPPEMCMDVLAQHLVSMAAVREYTVDEALSLLRQCAPYEGLTRADVESLLCMLSGDFERLQDRPVRPRLIYDRIHGVVRGDNYARMLACAAGGTISDKGMFEVYLEDGSTRLGELEEEFVFEARVGDRFFLGAFPWQIAAITRDRVLVRATGPEGAQSPFWRGDGQSRDPETGALFGRMLADMEEAHRNGTLQRHMRRLTGDISSATRLAQSIEDQINAIGCLPTHNVLIQEYFQDEAGEHQMMLHCPLGGQVNMGLGILLRRAAMSRCTGQVRVWHDDDGVLLHVMGGEVPPNLLESIDPADVAAQLAAELPGTARFSIAFRYCMDIALMMGMKSGGRTPLWVQRLRASEAMERAATEQNHPMLKQAMRDCLQGELSIPAIQALLTSIRRGETQLITRRTGRRPSPMTLSLRRQVEAEMMYDYAPTVRGAALLTNQSEQEIQLKPTPEHIQAATTGLKAPETADQLHARLLTEGDMAADELNAPAEWTDDLLDAQRAAYVEPGLYIAAEEQSLYDNALYAGDDEALARVLRRCLRYRGGMDAPALCQRYGLTQSRIEPVLNALVTDGALVREDDAYIHAQVYRRAQRMTIMARRSAVKTAPPEAFAALLARWQLARAGSPGERLKSALQQLMYLPLPTGLWEGAVLPARVDHYAPDMLDALLSDGAAIWRLCDDGKQLAFYPADAVDWDTAAPCHDTSDHAMVMRNLLTRRGAQFTYALAASASGVPVRDVLFSMARAGDVVCDSLSPLRPAPGKGSAKQRVMGRMRQTEGGRWEVARPILPLTAEGRIDLLFSRYGILCRETAALEDVSFAALLPALRKMEYTGQCRRGYFVQGLSGAQFVRREDFDRITMLLNDPADECAVLCAADPAQAFGRALPRPDGCDFLCVPGTHLVLDRGRIALILERSGAVLRAPAPSEQAVAALVQAFRDRRLLPERRILTVKEYPASLAPMLKDAGFVREMRDMALE